jgi:hypothetical protein
MPIIEGQVLDKENNPIQGIWVRIYRGDNQLDRTGQGFTDQNGMYDIRIDPGSPILIRYDDRRFLPGIVDTHPAIVTLISGVKDQKINKVLHNVAMGYSLDELLEIMSTYERIYFIDTADFIPLDDELRRRYPENLQSIKWVDPFTEQRLKQVRELYNHRSE